VALFVVGAVTLEEVGSREAFGADLASVLVGSLWPVGSGRVTHITGKALPQGMRRDVSLWPWSATAWRYMAGLEVALPGDARGESSGLGRVSGFTRGHGIIGWHSDLRRQSAH
jgi:hypothetical protein